MTADEHFEAIRLTMKQQAEERKQELLDVEKRLNEASEKQEARLIEVMRGMQTELLRGFEAFTGGQTIRLRKLEADQSNLDAALSGRVQILEDRLHQIELRLGRGERG